MSAYTRVPFTDIDITSGFWAYRQKLNRDVTTGAVMNRFLDTGRFEAFKCEWREGMPNKPHIFYDSDVAKWIEGVAYLIEKQPCPEFEALAEETIDLMERQQTKDGYINSYFNGIEPAKRWTIRAWHELYCAGHLIEAAVAWKHATGRDRFEKMMCKYADYIYRVFVTEDSACFATPGHEEIELALVKLYDSTGDKKYLELSRHFLDKRGNNDKDVSETLAAAYSNQSYAPVTQMTTAEGHAVRASYLYSAMADIALKYGDQEYKAACKKIFDNIVTRRMYLTGGVGSTKYQEAYTCDFDLPNETAYTETCASIALAYFASRMSLLEPDGKYADCVEKVIYNGFLSGTSLDGKCFFYSNPMEIRAYRTHGHHASEGKDSYDWLPARSRVEVFSCSCCPPNITRFVASLGDYMLSYNEERVYLHQFFNAEAKLPFGKISVSTNYPVDGNVSVKAEGLGNRKLCVRVPGWCAGFTADKPYTLESGYAVFEEGVTEAALSFDMTPAFVEANPNVHDCTGKVALMRGPVVYCLEGHDNPAPLFDLKVDPDTYFKVGEYKEGLLPNIQIRGFKRPDFGSELYKRFTTKKIAAELTFIPYYTFANRGETDMRVWIDI